MPFPTQKLAFAIVAVSSYDEEFPPQNLLVHHHNPLATGWQSERFCTYPQAIILRLTGGVCRLRKLQILSHHFKIATKVELFLGKTLKRRPLEGREAALALAGGEQPTSVSDSQHSMTSKPFVTKDLENGGVGIRSRLSGISVGDVRMLSDKVVSIPIAQSDGVAEHTVEFSRLGYVSLSDNAASDYKARELKSVHIDVEGDFVKIVLHQNFINAMNLYNQVGIVAFSVLGEPRDLDHLVNNLGIKDTTPNELDASQKELLTNPNLNGQDVGKPFYGFPFRSGSAEPKDLAFELGHDQSIMKIMSSISAAKEVAVKEEKFTMAKSLKILFYLAKKASEEVARLQIEKARAVDQEDYETAEDIRASVILLFGFAATKLTPSAMQHKQIDIEQVNQALSVKITEFGFQINGSGEVVPAELPPQRREFGVSLNQESTIDQPKESSRNTSATASITGSLHTPKPGSPDAKAIQSSSQTEPPVPVVLPPPPAPPKSPPLPALKNTLNQVDPNVITDAPPPGLDDPERLSEQQKDEFEEAIEVYGEFLMRCILSRQFKLREWALEEVSKRLEVWQRKHGIGDKLEDLDKVGKSKLHARKMDEGHEDDVEETIRISWTKETPAKPVDDQTFISATFTLIRIGVDDTREKVVILAISVWDQLTRLSVKLQLAPQFVFRFLDTLFPNLLVKASDMNPRIKQGCMDLIVTLAEAYHVMPHSIFKYLVKPIQTKPGAVAAWRPAKARLEALLRVIEVFKVDDAKDREASKDGSGLTVETAMLLTQPQLQHKNNEVREVAVKIVVELAIQAGELAITPYLKDTREQLMQIIQDKIGERKGILRRAKLKSRGLVKDGDPEVVMRLQEEVEVLRELVETGGPVALHSSGLPDTHANVPSPSKKAKTPIPSEKKPKKTKKETTIKEPEADSDQFDPKPKKKSTKGVKANASDVGRSEPEGFESKKSPKRDRVKSGAEDKKAGGKIKVADPSWLAQDDGDDGLGMEWSRTESHIYGGEFGYTLLERLSYSMHLSTLPSVEIPLLTSHMLSECDNRSIVKVCPRCQEAVMSSEFVSHLSRQSCIPASTIPGVSRCPLCHQDVPNGDVGWKRHLLRGEGCSMNERKPRPAPPLPSPGKKLMDNKGLPPPATQKLQKSIQQSPQPQPQKKPAKQIVQQVGTDSSDVDIKQVRVRGAGASAVRSGSSSPSSSPPRSTMASRQQSWPGSGSGDNVAEGDGLNYYSSSGVDGDGDEAVVAGKRGVKKSPSRGVMTKQVERRTQERTSASSSFRKLKTSE
ncbi:hypothetical protein HDU76_007381, partial [Blyttiomyces sp. JEL0837]